MIAQLKRFGSLFLIAISLSSLFLVFGGSSAQAASKPYVQHVSYHYRYETNSRVCFVLPTVHRNIWGGLDIDPGNPQGNATDDEFIQGYNLLQSWGGYESAWDGHGNPVPVHVTFRYDNIGCD